MAELELYKVESAVSATSARNLTPGTFALDVCIALGFAGMRNVLGWSMIQLLNSPSLCEVRNVIDELARQLAAMRKIEFRPARDASWSAVMWWWDSRCQECGGRGVVDKQQRQCPRCHGKGRRPVPEADALIKDAIGLLIEAEAWMERQLASKLKGSRWNTESEVCHVHLPRVSGVADTGFNSDPNTGFVGHHCSGG